MEGGRERVSSSDPRIGGALRLATRERRGRKSGGWEGVPAQTCDAYSLHSHSGEWMLCSPRAAGSSSAAPPAPGNGGGWMGRSCRAHAGRVMREIEGLHMLCGFAFSGF